MPKFSQKEINAVIKVMQTDNLMRYRGGEGGCVDRFERNLRRKMASDYALTVNSGTSALICALAGMKIGPGDEVIVPSYTWVASALAVVALGAVPVLAEIDGTLTIDPDDVERKITKRTKAVIPVHMANLCCDMDRLCAIAAKHKIMICEDACQGVGLFYKGRRLGAIGDAGTFSFNLFKNITCAEGGALLTNKREIYERAIIYHDAGAFSRNHAKDLKQQMLPGVNYRVSEIQGAIMVEQLKKLDRIVEKLRKKTALARSVLDTRKFRISPHNDEDNAANLSIIFDSKKEADAFGEANNMTSAVCGGRHVYTNWEPLTTGLYVHPALNPYNWSDRKVPVYDEKLCPKSIDILSRTYILRIGATAKNSDIEKKIRNLK